MAEYIEREAAIKCAENSYKMWNLTMAAADGEREINKCYKMQELCKAISEVFKIVPAADVEPVRHGYWEMKPEDTTPGIYHVKKAFCTNCGKPNKQYRPPFCPHCGAKMDEEEHKDNV